MKYKLFFSLIIGLFLISLTDIKCQDRKKLENEKNNNIEKLKLTRNLLDNTREEYKSGYNKINLISRGINYREQLIKNYEEEEKWIEYDIKEKNLEIKGNKEELRKLKNAYEKIIKYSYRNIDSEDALMYILSSKDINQGYQRIRYIKKLNDYRNYLYENIKEKNRLLELEIDSLGLLREKKESTKEQLEKEKSKLLVDKNQRVRIVNQLKSREKQLLTEIKKREAAQRQIEEEIKRAIEEEERKAREANKISSLTPRERIIDEEFSKNAGGLPWPTEQGIVTGEFGRRTIPGMENLRIYSNGIDINTVTNANVRSVFKGEVTSIVPIIGSNYTIIIKHGNYRTIYQNVVDVKVKIGDIVETKEDIGHVGANEDGNSILHFEVWNQKEKNNPRNWLSK